MPILDVISFKFNESQTPTSPALQSFLNQCKAYEGVLGAWSGFQVEDPAQFFVVVFWRSYANLTAANKDSYFPNLPTTLPIAYSTLQRKLFDINQYPEAALAAPITDMTFMFQKPGYTYEKDVSPILNKFTQLHGTGAMGAYWGRSTEVEGMSIIMIGWNSVQEHYDAGKIPAYKELNDSAVPILEFDLKHVSFEKIF